MKTLVTATLEQILISPNSSVSGADNMLLTITGRAYGTKRTEGVQLYGRVGIREGCFSKGECLRLPAYFHEAADENE